MKKLATYLPTDRRHALARGKKLPTDTQGAALFADISGFTPLTEALVTTLGEKNGAEELSRHLNRVYDSLIAEVDCYRGSVMTFSGDAITCWFEGDTGWRAVTCGLAMQAAMSQFAKLSLPKEKTAELKMKVGIASGKARRLVVGDPTIQLIDVVAGTTIDRMAAAERNAKHGEVVVSAEVYRQLGAQAHVARAESSFVVISGLKRRARQRPWPALPVGALKPKTLQPWLLSPIYDRLREGSAKFLAEIQPDVALFLKFGGIDYDNDPEAGNKLDTYVRRVQQVVDRYGAFMLQLTLGDKGCYLYATFGAPIAHENDSQHALEAALELQDLSREFKYIGGVRIGLNQGQAWCGAYGGRTRHTYGVLSDAVNVAARLMDQAKPGEILLTSEMAKPLQAYFKLEAMDERTLKGKSVPVPVSRLAKVQPPSAPLAKTVSRPALVGRERDLLMLMDIWQTVSAGASRVVRLTGAQGVGKSHLVDEFAIEVANRDGLVCVGRSQINDTAYRPWRVVLMQLLNVPEGDHRPEEQAVAALATLQVLQPRLMTRAPLLGGVLGVPISDNPVTAELGLDPALRREALWTLVIDIVRAVARQRPVLLWFDDVHWMDGDSRALLVAVSQALDAQACPVLLLGTRRPLPAWENDPFVAWEKLSIYRALLLTELRDSSVTTLVENQLGGKVQPLALAFIRRRVQGNAFYTCELVKAMQEAGHLVQRTEGVWHLSKRIFDLLRAQHCLVRDRQNGWLTLSPDARIPIDELGIPDSIQRAFTARKDALEPKLQETLKTASVIGPRFEIGVLAQVHLSSPKRDALESQMAELERRAFVRPIEPNEQQTYIFEHNLIQEVIYNGLLAKQRLELHTRVGKAIKDIQPDAVEQLAYHFDCAGLRDPAAYYSSLAADKARREYANETALKYYEQALRWKKNNWEWRKAQVEVLHILGPAADEEEALNKLEAIRAAPAFDIAYLWGQYYESIGNYLDSEKRLKRALTIARDKYNRLDEANSLTLLGLVAYRRGHHKPARDWFEKARALFDHHTHYLTEEAQVMAKASNGIGLTQIQLRQLPEAISYFQQALTFSRQCGDKRSEARSLANSGLATFQQRSFSIAQDFHQQALDLSQSIGYRMGQSDNFGDLAKIATYLGNYQQAQERYKQTEEIQKEINNRWGRVNTQNGLGTVYEELGNFSDALQSVELGLELSRAIGDRLGEAYLLSTQGLVAIDQKDWETAEDLLTRGLAMARELNDPEVVAALDSYLGEARRQKGELEVAQQSAEKAQRFRKSQTDLREIDDLATLALIRLALSDVPGAELYAKQVLEALQACKAIGPEFPQRAYWACYRVLDANHQTETARAALQAAYDIVSERASLIANPEIRRSFLENAPRNRQVMEDARRVLKI